MPSPQPRADGSPLAPSPVHIVLLLFLAVFLGYLIGIGAAYGLCILAGKDLLVLLEQLSSESPRFDRQLVRFVNGINHAFTFLLPGLAVTAFAYGSRWKEGLRLAHPASFRVLLLGMVFILVAFPFAQWLYQINQALPLPHWLTRMDESAEDMILALLRMQVPSELLVNLLVIALLPALGEELIFRGVLQQQLQRLSDNPHLAVWTAAVIFSLFHLQFQGCRAGLALGALLGYRVWCTASLCVPMLAHLANSAVQVLAQYAWKDETVALLQPQAGEEAMHGGWGLLSLFLILGMAYFFQARSSSRANSLR